MKKITQAKENTIDASLTVSNLGVAAKNASKALKRFLEVWKRLDTSANQDSKN